MLMLQDTKTSETLTETSGSARKVSFSCRVCLLHGFGVWESLDNSWGWKNGVETTFWSLFPSKPAELKIKDVPQTRSCEFVPG